MPVQAQELRLPKPGVMVHLSPPMNPPLLKGVKVYTDNPFKFDFILDQGDSPVIASEAKQSHQEQLKSEANRLIKYFLASITVPEEDLWVNLSPYEKQRIIPNAFGQTEMGRDLLAQDYLLKQITASLIYPEEQVGKEFWQKIYSEAQKKFGTTNIPVNTFNKVWIVPAKAVVYENTSLSSPNVLIGDPKKNNQTVAYVVEAKLKVMLEQDYLAMDKNQMPTRGHVQNRTTENVSPGALPSELGLRARATQGDIVGQTKDVNALGSQIVREIVLPQLEQEVNEGKNFAALRQVYHSLILAAWYKQKIKNSILAKIFADKNKVAGVEYASSLRETEGKEAISKGTTKKQIASSPPKADPRNDIEIIYHQYLQAFKKGVFNYIKEEADPSTQEMIPRKYFSGGVMLSLAMAAPDAALNTNLRTSMIQYASLAQAAQVMLSPDRVIRIEVDASPAQAATPLDSAMTSADIKAKQKFRLTNGVDLIAFLQVQKRLLRQDLTEEELQRVMGALGLITDTTPFDAKQADNNYQRIYMSLANRGYRLEDIALIKGDTNEEIRLDVVDKQSGNPKQQAILEAISNSIDALGGRIGQFGKGVKQILDWLADEGDYVEIISAQEDGQGFKLVIQRLEGTWKVQVFSQEKIVKGTTVRLIKQNPINAKSIVSLQDLFDSVHQRFAYSENALIKTVYQGESKKVNGWESRVHVVPLGYAHQEVQGRDITLLLSEYEISITDNGKGMAVGTLSKMFVPGEGGTKESAPLKKQEYDVEKKFIRVIHDTDAKKLEDKPVVSIVRNGEVVMSFQLDNVNPDAVVKGELALELARFVEVPQSRDKIILKEEMGEALDFIVEQILKGDKTELEQMKYINTIAAALDQMVSGNDGNRIVVNRIKERLKKQSTTLVEKLKAQGYLLLPDRIGFENIDVGQDKKAIYVNPALFDFKGPATLQGLGGFVFNPKILPIDDENTLVVAVPFKQEALASFNTEQLADYDFTAVVRLPVIRTKEGYVVIPLQATAVFRQLKEKKERTPQDFTSEDRIMLNAQLEAIKIIAQEKPSTHYELGVKRPQYKVDVDADMPMTFDLNLSETNAPDRKQVDSFLSKPPLIQQPLGEKSSSKPKDSNLEYVVINMEIRNLATGQLLPIAKNVKSIRRIQGEYYLVDTEKLVLDDTAGKDKDKLRLSRNTQIYRIAASSTKGELIGDVTEKELSKQGVVGRRYWKINKIDGDAIVDLQTGNRIEFTDFVGANLKAAIQKNMDIESQDISLDGRYLLVGGMIKGENPRNFLMIYDLHKRSWTRSLENNSSNNLAITIGLKFNRGFEFFPEMPSLCAIRKDEGYVLIDMETGQDISTRREDGKELLVKQIYVHSQFQHMLALRYANGKYITLDKTDIKRGVQDIVLGEGVRLAQTDQLGAHKITYDEWGRIGFDESPVIAIDVSSPHIFSIRNLSPGVDVVGDGRSRSQTLRIEGSLSTIECEPLFYDGTIDRAYFIKDGELHLGMSGESISTAHFSMNDPQALKFLVSAVGNEYYSLLNARLEKGTPKQLNLSIKDFPHVTWDGKYFVFYNDDATRFEYLDPNNPDKKNPPESAKPKKPFVSDQKPTQANEYKFDIVRQAKDQYVLSQEGTSIVGTVADRIERISGDVFYLTDGETRTIFAFDQYQGPGEIVDVKGDTVFIKVSKHKYLFINSKAQNRGGIARLVNSDNPASFKISASGRYVFALVGNEIIFTDMLDPTGGWQKIPDLQGTEMIVDEHADVLGVKVGERYRVFQMKEGKPVEMMTSAFAPITQFRVDPSGQILLLKKKNGSTDVISLLGKFPPVLSLQGNVFISQNSKSVFIELPNFSVIEIDPQTGEKRAEKDFIRNDQDYPEVWASMGENGFEPFRFIGNQFMPMGPENGSKEPDFRMDMDWHVDGNVFISHNRQGHDGAHSIFIQRPGEPRREIVVSEAFGKYGRIESHNGTVYGILPDGKVEFTLEPGAKKNEMLLAFKKYITKNKRFMFIEGNNELGFLDLDAKDKETKATILDASIIPTGYKLRGVNNNIFEFFNEELDKALYFDPQAAVEAFSAEDEVLKEQPVLTKTKPTQANQQKVEVRQDGGFYLVEDVPNPDPMYKQPFEKITRLQGDNFLIEKGGGRFVHLQTGKRVILSLQEIVYRVKGATLILKNGDYYKIVNTQTGEIKVLKSDIRITGVDVSATGRYVFIKNKFKSQQEAEEISYIDIEDLDNIQGVDVGVSFVADEHADVLGIKGKDGLFQVFRMVDGKAESISGINAVKDFTVDPSGSIAVMRISDGTDVVKYIKDSEISWSNRFDQGIYFAQNEDVVFMYDILNKSVQVVDKKTGRSGANGFDPENLPQGLWVGFRESGLNTFRLNSSGKFELSGNGFIPQDEHWDVAGDNADVLMGVTRGVLGTVEIFQLGRSHTIVKVSDEFRLTGRFGYLKNFYYGVLPSGKIEFIRALNGLTTWVKDSEEIFLSADAKFIIGRDKEVGFWLKTAKGFEEFVKIPEGYEITAVNGNIFVLFNPKTQETLYFDPQAYVDEKAREKSVAKQKETRSPEEKQRQAKLWKAVLSKRDEWINLSRGSYMPLWEILGARQWQTRETFLKNVGAIYQQQEAAVLNMYQEAVKNVSAEEINWPTNMPIERVRARLGRSGSLMQANDGQSLRDWLASFSEIQLAGLLNGLLERIFKLCLNGDLEIESADIDADMIKVLLWGWPINNAQDLAHLKRISNFLSVVEREGLMGTKPETVRLMVAFLSKACQQNDGSYALVLNQLEKILASTQNNSGGYLSMWADAFDGLDEKSLMAAINNPNQLHGRARDFVVFLTNKADMVKTDELNYFGARWAVDRNNTPTPIEVISQFNAPRPKDSPHTIDELIDAIVNGKMPKDVNLKELRREISQYVRVLGEAGRYTAEVAQNSSDAEAKQIKVRYYRDKETGAFVEEMTDDGNGPPLGKVIAMLIAKSNKDQFNQQGKMGGHFGKGKFTIYTGCDRVHLIVNNGTEAYVFDLMVDPVAGTIALERIGTFTDITEVPKGVTVRRMKEGKDVLGELEQMIGQRHWKAFAGMLEGTSVVLEKEKDGKPILETVEVKGKKLLTEMPFQLARMDKEGMLFNAQMPEDLPKFRVFSTQDPDMPIQIIDKKGIRVDDWQLKRELFALIPEHLLPYVDRLRLIIQIPMPLIENRTSFEREGEYMDQLQVWVATAFYQALVHEQLNNPSFFIEGMPRDWDTSGDRFYWSNAVREATPHFLVDEAANRHLFDVAGSLNQLLESPSINISREGMERLHQELGQAKSWFSADSGKDARLRNNRLESFVPFIARVSALTQQGPMSLLLRRMKIMEQIDAARAKAFMDGEGVSVAQRERMRSFSDGLEGQRLGQANRLAQAKKLRHEDMVMTPQTDEQRNLLALGQRIARTFGFKAEDVFLAKEDSPFGGMFATGFGGKKMYLNAGIAIGIEGIGGKEIHYPTAVILHELAHLLERFQQVQFDGQSIKDDIAVIMSIDDSYTHDDEFIRFMQKASLEWLVKDQVFLRGTGVPSAAMTAQATKEVDATMMSDTQAAFKKIEDKYKDVLRGLAGKDNLKALLANMVRRPNEAVEIATAFIATTKHAGKSIDEVTSNILIWQDVFVNELSPLSELLSLPADELADEIRLDPGLSKIAERIKKVSALYSMYLVKENKVKLAGMKEYPDVVKELPYIESNWYLMAHVSALYHDIRHSIGAVHLIKLLAQALGASVAQVKFLMQVASVHDFDPTRNLDTPARVRNTIEALMSDWKVGIDGAEGQALDGNTKRSFLRDELKWNELDFYKALAIIQRSEFPFWPTKSKDKITGQEIITENPNYTKDGTTPLKEYEAYLDKIKKISGNPREEEIFTRTWAAYFAEFADKVNGYARLPFAQVYQMVKDLGQEKRNSGEAVTDESFLKGSYYFLTKLISIEEDKVLANKAGLTDIKWMTLQEAKQQFPDTEWDRLNRNIEGFRTEEIFIKRLQAIPSVYPGMLDEAKDVLANEQSINERLGQMVKATGIDEVTQARWSKDIGFSEIWQDPAKWNHLFNNRVTALSFVELGGEDYRSMTLEALKDALVLDYLRNHFVSSPAMNTSSAPSDNTGGIDLTAGKLPLEVQKQIASPQQNGARNDEGDFSAKGGPPPKADQPLAEAFGWNIDPAMLKRYENAPGLIPVIIRMEPMENLPAFLGLNATIVKHHEVALNK